MRQRNVKNKEEIITSSKYFLTNPENYIGKWKTYFQNNNPIYIEIGMGKGQFIIANAKRYPNINFIGIEKYDSILALALKKIDMELPNLVMIRLDAFNIDSIFKEEIDTIYLNFSDPWPKKRHAKRRLTHEYYLGIYDELFSNKNCKKIIMKTDNDDLFEFSLESFKKYGYDIKEISYDLHSENIFNIMTEYEKKFSKKGIAIKYVKAVKIKKEE